MTATAAALSLATLGDVTQHWFVLFASHLVVKASLACVDVMCSFVRGFKAHFASVNATLQRKTVLKILEEIYLACNN
jgi:hypothetical protein